MDSGGVLILEVPVSGIDGHPIFGVKSSPKVKNPSPQAQHHASSIISLFSRPEPWVNKGNGEIQGPLQIEDLARGHGELATIPWCLGRARSHDSHFCYPLPSIPHVLLMAVAVEPQGEIISHSCFRQLSNHSNSRRSTCVPRCRQPRPLLGISTVRTPASLSERRTEHPLDPDANPGMLVLRLAAMIPRC